MAQIKICPNCNYRNQAQQPDCEKCGTSLFKTDVTDAPALAPPKLSVNHRALFVPTQVEIIIGRTDRATGWSPDIDLTPFGDSSTTGVSRRHVRLIWNGEWQIEDLGSLNGTYLNHLRLKPGEVRPLKVGSVIQVGRLFIVYHG